MQNKRGMLSEDLYRLTWLSDPVISSFNGRIAYVSKSVNEENSGYRSHIRLMEQDGSGDIPFTSGDKDHSPAWSPDGTQLAFLRQYEDKPQIWIIAALGGEAQRLTDLAHGVNSFVWSPDGQRILIRSSVEHTDVEHTEDNALSTTVRADNASTSGKDEQPANGGKAGLQAAIFNRLNYKSDAGGLWNNKRSHLFVYNIGHIGTDLLQLTSGHYDIGEFAWSPDGNEIAFTAKIMDDHDIDPDLILSNNLYVIDAAGHNRRKLTTCEWGIYDLAYSPDGGCIAFFASDRSYYNATIVRLYSIPAAGGSITCLSADLDRPLGHGAISDMRSNIASTGPIFTADGSSIYSLFTSEGNVHIARFAADASSYEVITAGDREIYQFADARNGKLIVASADLTHPGDLFAWDIEAKMETRLTNCNEALFSEVEISLPETFWFKAGDGWDIQGWILKPIGYTAGTKVPTVLEIHGGPHAMYANTFMHEFQLLAANGYAVVYTNPRGGHGYGQTFVNACRGDYGGKDYSDLMEAVDYAVSTYDFIDSSRLGVTGGSYGGFMTNWIVGHTDRFQAAVTQRSISNWISFYGVSDIGHFFTEDQIGGNPWNDLERLWKHSPLAYVEQVQTPLLILHGENDLRCPIEQAEQLFIALKRLGKKTQFIRFPSSNHELSRGGNPGLRVQRLNHIVRWFDEHIEK
ncbi:S9 family peptidase [Paenibacillus sp. UMB4589-SE434]|uniref:S9 family peptidase n=1 Tax=Paenibacillus sp. UMB4589-SE434 TaxID=3046314 RepID=UPI00254A2F36|nr:S9 family peptidase [Paenibacillus sp. UMB4589-SE434]MDK8182255.1 S9 family peptidase [Paenibacillus sp. UMB4589-SE434]